LPRKYAFNLILIFLQRVWIVFLTTSCLAQVRALPLAQQPDPSKSNAACRLQVYSYGSPVSGHGSLWLTGLGLDVSKRNDVEVQSTGGNESLEIIPVARIEYGCTPTNCLIGIAGVENSAGVTRVRARCSSSNWSAWQTVSHASFEESEKPD
jgi:hypothetical protein